VTEASRDPSGRTAATSRAAIRIEFRAVHGGGISGDLRKGTADIRGLSWRRASWLSASCQAHGLCGLVSVGHVLQTRAARSLISSGSWPTLHLLRPP
jgi:hypothetical protein